MNSEKLVYINEGNQLDTNIGSFTTTEPAGAIRYMNMIEPRYNFDQKTKRE